MHLHIVSLDTRYPVLHKLSLLPAVQYHRVNSTLRKQCSTFDACSYIGAEAVAYSSIVLTQSHPPLSLSFHRLTLLSPVLTARTLPLRLQLTRHAAASTLSTVDFQSSKLS
jgi:hypothetical protein